MIQKQALQMVLAVSEVGLSVASRRTSSWQPPWADNHRFALEPLRFRLRSQGLRRQTYPP